MTNKLKLINLPLDLDHPEGGYFNWSGRVLLASTPNLSLISDNLMAHSLPAFHNPAQLLVLQPLLEMALNEISALLNPHLYLPHPPLPVWSSIFQRLSPSEQQLAYANLKSITFKAQALALVQRFFPVSLSDIPPHWEWQHIFQVFLRSVEHFDWFPVDWDKLNLFYELYQQQVADSADLAEFLTYIPAQFFGLGDTSIADNPPLEVIAALLDEAYGPLTDEYIHPALVNQIDRSRLRSILLDYQFDGLPEPICWVQDAARVVLANTDNVLLLVSPSPDCFLTLTWDNDFETVKQAWLEAQPLVEAVSQLCDWYDEAGDAVCHIVSFLLNLGGYHVS